MQDLEGNYSQILFSENFKNPFESFNENFEKIQQKFLDNYEEVPGSFYKSF